MDAVEALRGPDARAGGLRVVVAGAGLSGTAAAEALAATGAGVLVCDGRDPGELPARAAALGDHGVQVRTGPPAEDPAVLADADLVVASPGWPPHHPVLAAAVARGLPVWAEAELAWRLRGPHAPPWVCVTGTNGKTTTVGLVAAILSAGGARARTAGNIGTALTDVVRDPAPVDVLAVELSSFQLHGTTSVAAVSSACLNIAPDHLDWHGTLDAYAAAKGRVYDRTQRVAVHTVEDPRTGALARSAARGPDCRVVGVTTGVPAAGMLGVDDGHLVDRSGLGADGRPGACPGGSSAGGGPVVLASLADLVPGRGAAPPPHLVANALAAAALALGAGAPGEAVAAGLRQATLPAHRGDLVATWRGVRFVDDSKATNPHAADAALRSAGRDGAVVWIAGGQAKGVTYDDLVARHRPRLRAAVLLGADRDVVADALARHAPDVPSVQVDPPDTGGMPGSADALVDRVLAAAVAHARAGDTVLLAPGAASLDQFASYTHRGEAFAGAVHRLVAAAPPTAGGSASDPAADPSPTAAPRDPS